MLNRFLGDTLVRHRTWRVLGMSSYVMYYFKCYLLKFDKFMQHSIISHWIGMSCHDNDNQWSITTWSESIFHGIFGGLVLKMRQRWSSAYIYNSIWYHMFLVLGWYYSDSDQLHWFIMPRWVLGGGGQARPGHSISNTDNVLYPHTIILPYIDGVLYGTELPQNISTLENIN